MDGTLLTDSHEISPETEKWIHKAIDAGVHVCLSTGRGYEEAISYGRQLGLQTPMVTVNGSEIWKSPEELYHRELFDSKIISKLRDIAREKNVWFWAYAVEGTYNVKNLGFITSDTKPVDEVWL